jgi:hypothetical protein
MRGRSLAARSVVTAVALTACVTNGTESVSGVDRVAANVAAAFAGGGTYGDGSGPAVTPTLVAPAINSGGALTALCPAPKKWFKINSPADGFADGYTESLNGVDITIRHSGGVEYLDWSAQAGVTVDFVRVKGGTSENVYE